MSMKPRSSIQMAAAKVVSILAVVLLLSVTVVGQPSNPPARWGFITGTLSNQTDLQTALNSKAAQSSLANYLPLTGGTMTGPLEVRGTSGAQITGSYDASNKFTLEATSAGRLNIGASSNEIYFQTGSASTDALSIILGGGSGQTRIYGRAGTTRRLILGNSLAGDIIDMGNYGSNPTLGFYGKSPVAKPASTDDLKDALVNLGLYTSGGATPLDLDGGTLSAGQLALAERSADPSDPAEGQSTIWQSDGTGSGDDGDIMVKITAGGVTKTITLIDFSAF